MTIVSGLMPKPQDINWEDNMQRVPDEITESDCSYTQEVKCPYCGEEFTDSWELKPDESQVDCGECGKEFSYARNVEVTYTTAKVCECGHAIGYHGYPVGNCRHTKTAYGMKPGDDMPLPVTVPCGCKEFKSV